MQELSQEQNIQEQKDHKPFVHANIGVNNHLWRKIVEDRVKTFQTACLGMRRGLFNSPYQGLIAECLT